jgi:hypothetical protein
MATLKQIYDLGQTTDLRERVMAAVVRQAGFIFAESSPAAARLALARQAVLAPEGIVAAFARQCADNGTIQTEAVAGDGTINTGAIPDNDIIYVVSVVWDRVAGVVATP